VTLLIKTVIYEIVRLSGVEAFSYFVEITNLIPKVESMTKLRPGLSGNPFLLVIKFNLIENVMQKRLGAEDGLRRPNKYCLGKSFCI